MITVIVVDDHKIFRQGLIELLQTTQDIDINIIAEVGDGHEAFEIIKDKKPDLAIVDVSMPGLNGLELTKSIIKEGFITKIMVLTMHKDAALADNIISLGASGYILKDNDFEDLIYAIKKIIKGEKFISSSISDDILSLKNRTNPIKKIITDREKEVLCLIAKGFTNKKVAKELFISVKTVETHRTNIMNKLGVNKVAGLVRYAIEMGLITK